MYLGRLVGGGVRQHVGTYLWTSVVFLFIAFSLMVRWARSIVSACVCLRKRMRFCVCVVSCVQAMFACCVYFLGASNYECINNDDAGTCRLQVHASMNGRVVVCVDDNDDDDNDDTKQSDDHDEDVPPLAHRAYILVCVKSIVTFMRRTAFRRTKDATHRHKNTHNTYLVACACSGPFGTPTPSNRPRGDTLSLAPFS